MVSSKRDFAVDTGQTLGMNSVEVSSPRDNEYPSHINGSWTDEELASMPVIVTEGAVSRSREEDDLPEAFPVSHEEIDHRFPGRAFDACQDVEGSVEPKRENGGISALVSEEAPGEVARSPDENLPLMDDRWFSSGHVIGPDLRFEREILTGEGLKMKVIRRRGSTARAVVNKDEIRREVTY